MTSSGNWVTFPVGGGSPTTVPIYGYRSGVMPAMGDYDGDGRVDSVTFLNGVFYAATTSAGSFPYWLGNPGDIATPGNYEGTVKTSWSVYRPSSFTWYYVPGDGTSPVVGIIMTGAQAGDIPCPGDYDGDGKTDFIVYRPSTGNFYGFLSSNMSLWQTYYIGNPGDIAIPGDYDGDGAADFALYRPTTGIFYDRFSSNPNLMHAMQGPVFQTGDQLVPGDYDNDGQADFALFRPSTSTWYLILSSNPVLQTVTMSLTGTGIGANMTPNGNPLGPNLATRVSGSRYVVSGVVTDSSNAPVSGVTISAAGGVNKSTITDSRGIYSLSLPANQSYTISATLTGYTFASAPIQSISSNTSENFTGGSNPITLSTTSVNFNNVADSTAASPQTVTLTNNTAAALAVSVSISGSNYSDFVIQTNNCASASIPAGGSCQVNVSVTPTMVGSESATLTFNNSASSTPPFVHMLVTGTAPIVSLSTTAPIAFGNIPVGGSTPPSTQSINLSNNGNATLSISSIAIVGTDAPDFQQTNNCGSSITVGSTCSITITASPTAPGSEMASLVITDSAAHSPQSLNLSVNGTGTDQTIVQIAAGSSSSIGNWVSDAGYWRGGTAQTPVSNSINLGIVEDPAPMQVYQQHRYGNGMTYTIANLTPGTSYIVRLHFAEIVFSNTGVRQFNVSINNVPALTNFDVVAAAGGEFIAVVEPFTAVANSSGQIVILFSVLPGATNAPIISGIELWRPYAGTPTASLSTTGLSFGSVQVGSSSGQQTITMSNNGSAPLLVSSITKSGLYPNDFTLSDPCSNHYINVGSTCAVGLTATPTISGVETATLSFADSASETTQVVTLSVTGTPVAHTAGQSQISGNVIYGGSGPLAGRPVANAIVALTVPGNSTPQQGFVTGADGNFRFTVSSGSSYNVSTLNVYFASTTLSFNNVSVDVSGTITATFQSGGSLAPTAPSKEYIFMNGAVVAVEHPH